MSAAVYVPMCACFAPFHEPGCALFDSAHDPAAGGLALTCETCDGLGTVGLFAEERCTDCLGTGHGPDHPDRVWRWRDGDDDLRDIGADDVPDDLDCNAGEDFRPEAGPDW